MHVSVDRNALYSALTSAVRATTTRSTMPTIAGVLLEAEADRGVLSATGTDLEIAITASCEASVSEGGRALVPAKLLADAVRRMGDGLIYIESSGHDVTVRWGRSRIDLRGLDPLSYPTMPTPDRLVGRLSADKMRAIAQGAMFAVGTDESRPTLMGARVAFGEGIHATATDGYRVATVHVTDGWTAHAEADAVLIPGRALREIERMAREGDCAVYVGESTLQVQCGQTRVTTRLIDGSYPDVLSLLPRDYPIRVRCGANDLLAALDRVSLMSIAHQQRSPLRGVVRITLGPASITVAADGEAGAGSEDVEASILGGQDLSIAFNSRYLVDGLKVIAGEVVVLEFIDPMRPVRISAEGNGEYTYWCLPVKL